MLKVRLTYCISEEPREKQVEILENDSDKNKAIANNDDGGANPKLMPFLNHFVLIILLHFR